MTFQASITKVIAFSELHCGECDIDFAVPTDFKEARLKDGKTWYCPRGHPRVFRDSDLERTRKLLEEANRRNSTLVTDLTLARADAEKARKEKRRLLKRASAGLCPCCRRTFVNLQRHMATKHPTAVEKP